MDSARWRRLRPIIEEAAELSGEALDNFKAQAMAAHPDLAHELSRLLSAASGEGLLDRGVASIVGEAVASEVGSLVDAELAPGTRIGSYTILEKIGSGGMGSVYRAERRDSDFRQVVALKLLRDPLPGSAERQRFHQERQVLASLRHPNIAQLLDVGETEDGRSYFTLELVEGRPVTEYCESHRLTLEQRVAIVSRVAQALSYAHQKLVVHRDIKPSNILVTEDGTPKLLDFGISKLIDQQLGAELTRFQQAPMTPEYAAPEQFKGQPISTATDVYQLATVLYKLITRAYPFGVDTTDPVAWSSAVCEREPDSLRRAITRRKQAGTSPADVMIVMPKSIGKDLDAIVMRALEKAPEKRYLSMDAFNADLRAFLEDRPTFARPAGTWLRVAKFVRRNRLSTGVAALAVFAVCAGAGLATWQAARAREAARVANAEAEYSKSVSDFLVRLFEVSDPGENRGATLTADQLLDAGARRLDEDEHPLALTSRLARVFGRVYEGLGEYAKAEEALARALDAQRASGSHPLEDATLLAERARVLRRADKHDLAMRDIEAARAALSVAERDGTNVEIERAKLDTLNGSILNDMGDYDQAKERLDGAIGVLTGAPMDRDTQKHAALAFYARANLLSREGDARGAVVAGRRALEILQAQLHPDHPELLDTKQKLSLYLTQAGLYGESLPMMQEVVDAKRRIYRGRGPQLSRAIADLGVVFIQDHRYQEGKNASLEALALLDESGGGERSDRYYLEYAVAETDLELGNLEAALARFEVAAEGFSTTRGRTHATVAGCYLKRADIFLKLGRPDDALAEMARIAPDAVMNELTRIEVETTRAEVEIRRGNESLGKRIAADALKALEAIDRETPFEKHLQERLKRLL